MEIPVHEKTIFILYQGPNASDFENIFFNQSVVTIMDNSDIEMLLV